ncbi:hypothetical protein Ahy_B02g057749 [Arachis hypogaea]|uniref:SWIM-type domain-containing protein n=1 Tax=Arachis hypogaea TaxID=3818 RepID=A0A445ACW5_ARAHY|nr:hypothetical protein Ahy_B02g057749 [Arachis hypogaea]
MVGGLGESRGGRVDVASMHWSKYAPRGGRAESARGARIKFTSLYKAELGDIVSVMEGTANLVVYRNGEIIHNTHEGVKFVSQNPFSFVVPCTMTLMELQNGLCQSMENGTLMRVSRILYRNLIVVFGGLIQFDVLPITDEASMQNMFQIHRQTQMRHPQIELYVEFETVEVQNDIDIHDDRAAVYEGMNSDSEEDFEATYEAGDEDEDGDVGVEAAAENVVVHPSSSQPMDVPPFMRELDLEAMHAPEFPEYANIDVVDPEDGEFRIGMEYIPHLQKLVVNIGYSRTVEEYNINYKRLEERGEAYARWCDAIGLRHWVLAFDEGHRWGHMTTNLVECINSVLKGARNLPVLALVRATYYRLNELFTRKSAETHERKRAGYTYSAFAQQRIEASMQQARNIVVHRFDRRNEVFEVREMNTGKVLVVDLARRTCGCGHFQVERIPCRHVIACCANQRLDWQLYVHEVYKMTEVRKVYRFEFTPLGDPETWPAYEGPKGTENP